MNKYVYVLKSKYKKNPKLLIEYGFLPYECEEDESGAFLYGQGIVLNKEGTIFKYLVSCLEKIRKKEKDSLEDFEKEGIQFDNEGKLILNEQLEKELTGAQLCVAFDSLDDYGVLFINVPNATETYYSYKDIEKNCKHIIEKLLSCGIIYRKKVKSKNAKRHIH